VLGKDTSIPLCLGQYNQYMKSCIINKTELSILIAIIIILIISCIKLLAHPHTYFTCTDFYTQIEAQNTFDIDPIQFASLDGDKDGKVCEHLRKQ
jgi:hypothetical protein